MKRRAFKLMMFALAGAIVNVAVAWGCAGWSSPTNYGAIAAEEVPAWLDRLSADKWTWRSRNGFGYQQLWRDDLCEKRIAADKDSMGEVLFGMSFMAPWDPPDVACSGWPCKATFSSSMTEAVEAGRGLFRAQGIKISQSNDRRISLRLIFPGFAINTILYAAILWVLLAVPGVLNRKRRVRRGLCVACGYALRGSTSGVCSECGSDVRKAR